MKSILPIILAFIFLLCIIQVQSQNSRNINDDDLKQIVERVVRSTKKMLNCNYPHSNEKVSYLVWLHYTNQDIKAISIEKFPFYSKILNRNVITGYFEVDNDFVFVANGQNVDFEPNDKLNNDIESKKDSIFNCYESWRGDGKIVMSYFYYLYDIKTNPICKRKIKMTYQCFSDVSMIPLQYRNNWILDNENYEYDGNIFRYCRNFYLMSEEEKEKLKRGTIKMKL